MPVRDHISIAIKARPRVSGGTDWVKAAGAFIFFLGVSVYGAWKLWPQKEIVASWEETDLLSYKRYRCCKFGRTHYKCVAGTNTAHLKASDSIRSA